MAKVKYRKPKYQNVSEGNHVFRIYDCYADEDREGKIVLSLVNANGETHNEYFFTVKANGELNDYALGEFSKVVDAALDEEFTEDDEIDPEILIDYFIRAEYYLETNEETGKQYGHIRHIEEATEKEFEENDPVDKAYDLSPANRPKNKKELQAERREKNKELREAKQRERKKARRQRSRKFFDDFDENEEIDEAEATTLFSK